MPTRAAEAPGVAPAAKGVAEHATALAKLEIRLALLELKRKLAAVGAGAGLAVGAGITALFGLGFAFATGAAALAIVLPSWLALLIVAGALLATAGLLALLALGALRRGVPPVPEQAIEEAKKTSEAVRRNGSHAGS
jgi:hypothetical protein